MPSQTDAILVITSPAASAARPDVVRARLSPVQNEIEALRIHGHEIALILLIGDLTESGSIEDFALLRNVVDDLLLMSLSENSSDLPLVVGVPGPRDGRPLSPYLAQALNQSWPSVAEPFWAGEEPSIVAAVTHAFSTFIDTFNSADELAGWRRGVVPGDVWGEIALGAVRTRVAVVNSAFRMLNRDVQPGELTIDVRQLRAMGLDPVDLTGSALLASPLVAAFTESGASSLLLAGASGAPADRAWTIVPEDRGYAVVLPTTDQAAPAASCDGVPLACTTPQSPPAPGNLQASRTPFRAPTAVIAEPDESAVERKLDNTLGTGRAVLVVTAGWERFSTGPWGQALMDAEEFQDLLVTQLGAVPGVPLSELVHGLRRDKVTRAGLENSIDGAFRDTGSTRNRVAETILNGPWVRVYDFTGTDVARLALANSSVAVKADLIDARTQPYTANSGRLAVIMMNGGPSARGKYEVDFDLEFDGGTSRSLWFGQFATDILTNPVVFLANDITSPHLWRYVEQLPRRAGKPFQSYFVVAPGADSTARFRLSQYAAEHLPMSVQDFASRRLKPGHEPYERGKRLLMRQRHGQVQGSGVRLVSDLINRASGSGDGKFLWGQDPTWADIKAQTPARLSTLNDMWEKSGKLGEARPILLLTDRSGTGKTTSLMQFGVELMTQDHAVGWVNRAATDTRKSIVDEVQNLDLDAVLVDDIDIFGARAADFLHQLNREGRTLVVATIRTTRADVLSGKSFGEIKPLSLTDQDLDQLVAALERSRELGELKHLLTRSSRVERLRQVADQDLMRAMHEVVYAYRLEVRVAREFDQLDWPSRRVYALVCLFYALQFEDSNDTLSEGALIRAASNGRPDPNVYQTIQNLVSTQRVLTRSDSGQIRSRHKVIAECIFDERIRVDREFFRELLTDLLGYYVRVAAHIKDPNDPHRRVMVRLLNHRIMVHSKLAPSVVRDIYHQLYAWLNDDFHYWLQCGSYELECGDLDSAANYLKSARGSTGGAAHFKVVTTWGLVCFRQALAHLNDRKLQREAYDSIEALWGVIRIHGADSPHTFAFLAREGVVWLDKTSYLDPPTKAATARRIAEAINIGKRIIPDNAEFSQAVLRSESVLDRLLDRDTSRTTIPL